MESRIELVLRVGDAELPVAVGDVLPARVLSGQTVWVAGVRMRARVPADVTVGETVRVRVAEADPLRQRVVLAVLRDGDAGAGLVDVRA